MAFNLRKKLEGVVAQVIPGDNKTYASVQRAQAPAPQAAVTPAPGQPRNLLQRGFEKLTPTNETAIRNNNTAIADANKKIAAKGQNGFGVLAQSQTNRDLFKKINAPTDITIPGQLSQAGEALGDTLINDFVQPATRSLAGAAISVAKPLSKDQTYTPGSRVEAGLFGAPTVSSYQKESIDQYRRDTANGGNKLLAGAKAAGLGAFNVAEGLGNAVPLAGAATKAISPVVTKAAAPVVQAARDAKLIAPSNLADNELASLSNYRNTMGTGALDDETYQAGRAAAEKAGLAHTDVDAIDNLLGAQRSYDVAKSQRPSLLGNEGGYARIPTGAKDPVPEGMQRLYRGLEQEFDPSYKLSNTDAPTGYSTFTDNPELARQYAGKGGFVYQYDVPKNKLAKELIDNDGERGLYVNNEKPAGINGVSGDEYLVYNYHDDFNPANFKEYSKKRRSLFSDEAGSIGRNIRQDSQVPPQRPQPRTKLVQSQTDSLPSSVPDEVALIDKQMAVQGIAPTLAPRTKLVRNRGLANNVTGNQQTGTPLRQELISRDTSYDVRNTGELQTRAANLVKADEDAALRMARNGTDDNAVATGLELVKKYQDEGNIEKAIDLIENLAPKLTEAGRTAQAASIYGRLTPTGALRFTQRQIDKYNEASGLVKNGVATSKSGAYKLPEATASKITDLATRIQKLPDGEEKTQLVGELTDTMAKVAPTPALEKISNIWRAGLLTSIRTLEGGVIGNTTKAALDIPSQAVASGIDRFVTAPLFNNGVRSNMFTLKGGAEGFGEGVQKAGNYLKTGIDPRDVGRGYDTNPSNYNQGNPILNTLGKGSDYVYRAMGAIDNPFYYAGLGRANREEALLEASARGLKGREAKQFADNYVPDVNRVENATDKAREGVFQNDTALGTIASAIKNAPQRIKNPQNRAAAQLAVDFLVPFVKIPSAVATALVNYSPAGVVLEVTKQSIRGAKGIRTVEDLQKLNKSIGQSTVGTIGGVYTGSQLYNNGMLTLEAPSDADERALWELEGKQPFSVNIGGKWRKLNYIQPLGSLMAIGGGYERAKAEGAENPVITAAASGLKSVSDQSFLKGVSGATSAIQDPARSAQTFANNTVGSFVPNFVKDVARATDSKERESNTPVDAIKNGIPGLRQSNLPQRDAFGKEIDRKQSPAGVLLDPFKSTTPKKDDVAGEIRRLYDIDPSSPDMKVAPSKLKKQLDIGGQKAVLNPDQLDKFESLVGAPAYDKIKSALADPEYQSLSDADKAKNIQNIISGTRNNAKEGFANTEILKDKKGNTLNFADTKFTEKDTDIKATGETSTKSKSPREEYDKALKAYEKDKTKFTTVEKIKKDKELAKLKVNSDFDKDTIDLYNLDKASVEKLITSDPNGRKLADNIIKYGDALVASGQATYNKYKDKYGNETIVAKPKKVSSGKKSTKGRKAAKAKKYTYKVGSFSAANKSNASTLRALLRKAQ